jgi:multidrug efflux pump subunit AcrA (membrane-fusion protein)
MKKRTKRIGFAVVAAALIGGVTVATTAKSPAPKISNRTETVSTQTLRSTTSGTGTVQPAQQVALSFPGSGRVSTLNAVPGQRVQAGEVLITLDDTDLRFELARKTAEVAEAKAKLKSLQSQVTNVDRKANAATAKAAQSSAKQAQRTETQLRSVSETAQAQLDQTVTDAISQNSRDQAQLVIETQRLADAQTRFDTDVANRETARTKLEAARPKQGSATTQRDENRKLLNDARSEVSRLGLLRDDATRAYDIALADYERVRAANQATTDANGITFGVVISDKTVAAAKAAASVAATAVAKAEAEVVRLQGAGEGVGDMASDAEREFNAAQAKFDIADGRVSSSQATLDAARQRLDSARESVAKSADLITSAQAAKSAGVKREEQSVLSAANQSAAAKDAAATVAKQNQAREQGAKPADREAAEASIQMAEVALSQTRDSLSKLVLKAPFSGVIASVGVKVGEQVGTTTGSLGTTGTAAPTPPILLVDDSSVIIRLPLPEVDAARLPDKAEATITFDSLRSAAAPITTSIDSVEPTPTVVNGVSTYSARIRLPQAPKSVRLGMNATVEVLLGVRQGVMTVPAEALSEKDGATIVRVVEAVPQKTTKVVVDRIVSVGERSGGRVEIVGGLKTGEIVELPELGPKK